VSNDGSLHLLQNCMVYINTLMQQQVLAQPQWSGKLIARDLRALTPLIWEHVNPYGRAGAMARAICSVSSSSCSIVVSLQTEQAPQAPSVDFPPVSPVDRCSRSGYNCQAPG
jgi:hypothetical protein